MTPVRIIAATALFITGIAPGIGLFARAHAQQPSPPAVATGDQSGAGPSTRPTPMSGERVYREVCQACHMADAKGGTGAGTIPALAGNTNLQVPEYIVMMVANGRGAMPGFKDLLDPAQIAGVATYVRTHFGNKYAKPVTAEEVKRVSP